MCNILYWQCILFLNIWMFINITRHKVCYGNKNMNTRYFRWRNFKTSYERLPYILYTGTLRQCTLTSLYILYFKLFSLRNQYKLECLKTHFPSAFASQWLWMWIQQRVWMNNNVRFAISLVAESVNFLFTLPFFAVGLFVCVGFLLCCAKLLRVNKSF